MLELLMSKIKDLTGGFNLWNRKVLESIDLDKNFAEGYVFQIELKLKAFKAGFKFYEHPILFLDRVRGISKLDKAKKAEKNPKTTAKIKLTIEITIVSCKPCKRTPACQPSIVLLKKKFGISSNCQS